MTSNRNPTKCAYLALMPRALRHQERLRMGAPLSEQESHVSALSETVGIAQTAVSHQLEIFRARRFVPSARQDGRSVYRNEDLSSIRSSIGWEGAGFAEVPAPTE